ncbi:MAG: hypothetical protein V1855_04040 [bacterium]
MKLKKITSSQQTKQKRQRPALIPFLLASVGIHLLILLSFFSFSFKTKLLHMKEVLAQIAQHKKRDLPASLKPRKSEFGTFVFYEQPPVQIPKQFPKEHISEKQVQENLEKKLKHKQASTLDKQKPAKKIEKQVEKKDTQNVKPISPKIASVEKVYKQKDAIIMTNTKNIKTKELVKNQ